jgi:hypothetical protein
LIVFVCFGGVDGLFGLLTETERFLILIILRLGLAGVFYYEIGIEIV